MSDTTEEVYIERAPGDLLTAEDWNDVQRKVYADIRDTAQKAADGVTRVPKADDADHLEGKDLAALTDEVARRVMDQLRGKTGYQQLFRILKADEISELEHGLGTAPLVDVYKLDYFAVVAREDDETRLAYATFYLHHSTERRVRVTLEDGTRTSVDIQPPDFPDLGIPFADLLTRYHVPYTDTSTLDDLETEFWKAFFKAPNEQFGDDQYTHSPWFERCCKQKTTVAELKANGDWNDILFQFRPRKTVNYPVLGRNGLNLPNPRPANVVVQHLSNDRTAVWFVGQALVDPDTGEDQSVESKAREYITPETFDNELKVMILLKV
jgi:hypothetical protein